MVGASATRKTPLRRCNHRRAGLAKKATSTSAESLSFYVKGKSGKIIGDGSGAIRANLSKSSKKLSFESNVLDKPAPSPQIVDLLNAQVKNGGSSNLDEIGDFILKPSPSITKDLANGAIKYVDLHDVSPLYEAVVIGERALLNGKDIFSGFVVLVTVKATGEVIGALSSDSPLNQEDETDDCRYCKTSKPNITKELCERLERLVDRSNNNVDAVEKLCRTVLPQNFWSVVDHLLLLSRPAVIAFMSDIADLNCPSIASANSEDYLCNNVSSLDRHKVGDWHYLYSKHDTKAPNARKDWNTIVQFGKLKDNVKEYIVKFSDASATNSSLIKFCADLPKPLGGGSDVKFIDYVNDANNFTVVKKMVSHKLTAEEFEEVGEEYQIETSLVGLAKTWVDRSDKVTDLIQNGEDGRYYGKRAVVALLNNSLDLGITGIDQSQYKVFNEVQLWVDKAKGQYMIADILLVKFDGTNIEDVIICESKLSVGTRIIPNAKNKVGGGLREVKLWSSKQID